MVRSRLSCKVLMGKMVLIVARSVARGSTGKATLQSQRVGGAWERRQLGLVYASLLVTSMHTAEEEKSAFSFC